MNAVSTRGQMCVRAVRKRTKTMNAKYRKDKHEGNMWERRGRDINAALGEVRTRTESVIENKHQSIKQNF
jgi:hypothetical protein